MKKRKIIGLAIVLFVIFGVTGIAWYKQNVYIGIDQVKAIDKSKLTNNSCSTSNTVVLDSQSALSSKKFDVKTTGDYDYTIDIYAIDVTTEPGKSFFLNIDDTSNPNSLNADQYFQPDQTIPVKGATTTSVDLNKYTDTGKLILVDVTWSAKDEECLKGSYVKMNRGKTTNSEENISACQRWVSGEKINFEVDKQSFTLNENIDKYDAAKLAAFNQFKQSADVQKFCSSDNAFGSGVEKFMKVLKNMEEGFESSYIDSSATTTDNNPNIGDRNAYEQVENTNIENLYCKVNSVYLKDIDSEGKDRLEDSNTEGLALKLADKDSKIDSSGSAKANLYQFKYTKEDTVPYTVVSNGQTKEETACKVSCTEYLKVNFDPPQEVTAGTCFSYAVQVIAFTECDVKEKAAPPTPPVTSGLETVCVQNYVRNGVHPVSRFAGPEEDFDDCIKKCDGGKYSQKCSNKCFNEIYGDENSEIESNNAKATGLSLLNKPVLGTFMEAATAEQCPGVHSDYNTVRNFFKTHSSGTHYINSAGQVDFKSNYPGCYWAQYAPYALNDANFDETWALDIHHTNSSAAYAPNCVTSQGGAACMSNESWHNNIGAAGHGVKVRTSSCNLDAEIPACTLVCDAQCSYIASGPEASWNSEMASAEYETTMDNYKTAIAKCTADAACKTQKTTKSTFYIGVNDEEDKWSATNDTGNTSEPEHSGKGCVGTSGDLIIQGRDSTSDKIADGTGGLCYCGNEDYGEWQHYTRWTFPGHWVDKKTSKVYDKPPEDGEEMFFDGGYNKYCIDKKEKNDVNVSWLEELLANKEKYGNEKDARTNITDQTDKTWNISGKTTDFGNYGWNISLKCFYSLTTKTITVDEPEEPNDPDTPNDDSDIPDDVDSTPVSISSVNTRIKTADTQNPIPTKGGDGKKASWNWSEEATKLDIVSDDGFVYEVTPGAYRNYMEDLGDDVFTDDYLDYAFEFTGDDLRTIVSETAREGTNKFGDYSSGNAVAIVGTDEKKANSLYAYESSFIRHLPAGKAKKYPKGKAVRCNNLDSKGTTDGATRCADTSNGVIPTTDALAEFKSKIKK